MNTAAEWVLWGFHPAYCDGTPIRLTGGALRHCRAEQTSRTAEGFTCAIYKQGTAPAGLRAQASQDPRVPYETRTADDNRAYVRALLAERQPAFAAALEAVTTDLAGAVS